MNKNPLSLIRNFTSATSLEPFRGEVLSKELLALRAEELARKYSSVSNRYKAVHLKARFKDNWKALNSAYFTFSELSRNKGYVAAGADWLLDNFHVIDEQAREIRRDLPASYYKALPRLNATDWRGFPRAYRIACDYLKHTDSMVLSDALTEHLTAFQNVTILEIKELWAIPIMLRLAVVENLRRLSHSVLKITSSRQNAALIFESIKQTSDNSPTAILSRLLTQMQYQKGQLKRIAPTLVRDLRSLGTASGLAIQWIEEQLKEDGSTLNELIKEEAHLQAIDQISIGNCVTSLKQIGRLNWREWVEEVSRVHKILSQDNIGSYKESDFNTRDFIRHRIENLTKRVKSTEVEVAKKAFELASIASGEAIEYSPERDSAYYIIDKGLPILEDALRSNPPFHIRALRHIKENATTYYLAYILAFSLTLSALLLSKIKGNLSVGSGMTVHVVCFIAFLILSSQLSIDLAQWLSSKLIRPKLLPKLDFEKGVLDQARTAVVVQAIVSSRDHMLSSINDLEVRAICNSDPNIIFGILADLPDANEVHNSGDQGIIQVGLERIKLLNAHYKSSNLSFFIAFRERTYNEVDKIYMGWERKRGKLIEFNRLMRGDTTTTFKSFEGDLEKLQSCKYVITLDNDTQLPPNSAKKLIGCGAHPLVTPVLSADTEKKRGYGIIQPRVGITLESATASIFARYFSGQSGLDPYTKAVSDLYQDMFSEASYIGKGLYHVDSFNEFMGEELPDNAILSHDLLESGFIKCGLASDIELFDDFPKRYHAHAKRQHRWIRGDWQLLPWLGSSIPTRTGTRKSPFSGLTKWKIFDNLRRSIAPIFTFLFLLVIAAKASNPIFWLAVLFLFSGLRVYTLFYTALFSIPFGYSLKTFYSTLVIDFKLSFCAWFFELATLPHQAYLSVDAIIRTIYRIYISKKDLLQWETALQTEVRLKDSLESFIRPMAPCIIAGTLLTLWSLIGHTASLTLSLPLGLLWLTIPYVAWLISCTGTTEVQILELEDKKYLHGVALDTWSFFRKNLKAEFNWLIPDNSQLVPLEVVAERTSPTNISLSLLALVSAYDLGFIPSPLLVERAKDIINSTAKLERWNGHLLNWYCITDNRPLLPRYVSSVDNGNFIGHLITLKQAIKDISYKSLISNQVLPLLKEHSSDLLFSLTEAHDLLMLYKQHILSDEGLLKSSCRNAKLINLVDDLNFAKPYIGWLGKLKILEELGAKESLPKKLEKIDFVIQNRNLSPAVLQKIISRLLKNKDKLLSASLSDREKVRLNDLIRSLETASDAFKSLQNKIEDIQIEIEKLIKEMDFSLLFDKAKGLLSIGYNVENARLDSGSYDLLASEARLGSFIGIAKGNLPDSHWFQLGRTLTNSLGGLSLISWSGTMFEYLMPLVVMKDYPSTLLGKSYRSVIQAQKSYCLKRSVPWGISESAYGTVDYENTYQYRAFGVPGLGLKRGLVDDLVISPYSTVLSLMIDPILAVENLKRLERETARGEHGFYEAIDYTKERLVGEEDFHVVKSFFAHHQGMSLCSINNCLNDNVLQERFHSDHRVEACALFLQEKFPTRIPIIQPHQAEQLLLESNPSDTQGETREYYNNPNQTYPRTRVLSNGDYTVVVDQAGSGFSSYMTDLSISRFKADNSNNKYGTYLYLKDEESGQLWSNTYQPTCIEAESYEAIFSPDKAEYQRRNFGIQASTDIIVAPEDPLEIRRISLTNHAPGTRKLSITSFFEVALASFSADSAHPAFSKLFVSSEWLEDIETLVFTRRPRSAGDYTPLLFHFLATDVVWAPTEYTTDRYSFIGRGFSARNPLALMKKGTLDKAQGYVLDPIASIKHHVELDQGQSTEACFITGIAKNKEELNYLVRKYRENHSIKRAFELAWSTAYVELKNQQFSKSSSVDFQKLANGLIYNIKELRPSTSTNTLSQSALWRFGISGDEPICLLILDEVDQLNVFQELILAHEYLRQKGIKFDLVVLNSKSEGYIQALSDELESLLRTSLSSGLLNQRGGIFIRSRHHISNEEEQLLLSSARVALYGSKGSLSKQLVIPIKKKAKGSSVDTIRSSSLDLEIAVDKSEPMLGSFTNEATEYEMKVNQNALPPLPWSNVIGSDNIGFLVTDSGAGYTWAKNSREFRLSPWSNDPIQDPLGEVIYIRDIVSGDLWSPTPLPIPSNVKTTVKHGFGYTTFKKRENGITSFLNTFVDENTSSKIWSLNLKNDTGEDRSFELVFYFEWVLGVSRTESFRYINSNVDPEGNFLYARNYWNAEFADQILAVGASLDLQDYTTDRGDFLGPNARLDRPSALVGHSTKSKTKSKTPFGLSLSRRLGFGFDNCAVLKYQVDIPKDEETTVAFYVSISNDLNTLRENSKSLSIIPSIRKKEKENIELWKKEIAPLKVQTPSTSFDNILNGWLLYQTLSCRIKARTGFFQSSGAIGFRDQLQDSMAFMLSNPDRTRKQILVNATRQFEEGDVQHWWHPPSGRGIRSKISDNYMWMPLAVVEYLDATGRTDILDESSNYLNGPLLEEHQHDLYFTPEVSSMSGSLYEHCIKALDRSYKRGPNGLPLMGAGDWNDGMNLVGEKGMGESVWLGWFMASILKRFASVCEFRKDIENQTKYLAQSKQLVEAVEKNAWDGEWYKRAYFDDGTPLGSKTRDECFIDSLTQSWSVLTGLGDKDRRKTALDSTLKYLFDREHQLVRLLWPPFQNSAPSPGYIQSYPPGIRENGGQYTHGSTWLIGALCDENRCNEAFEVFQAMNPINHADTIVKSELYKTEPYVTCGDVYSCAPHAGRGGWSWYTGSSGWMYQMGWTWILGLKRTKAGLLINPKIPTDWHEYSVDGELDGMSLKLKVVRGKKDCIKIGKSVVDGKLISWEMLKDSSGAEIVVEFV